MTADHSIMVEIGAQVGGLTRGINEATARLTAFSNRTQHTFKAFREVGKVSAVAGGVMAAGLGGAIKTTMDFDAQMAKAGAVAGATGKDLQDMRNSAIDLGAKTSKSASEVADAMTEMAAKGYDAKQIIASMPGVIAASEASGASLATTSDVVSSALNGFGLAAKDATHVADVMSMSANMTAADVGDLGYAFKYAATPAKMLGVGMEELTTATGIMMNAGLDGSQAGTTLRASFLRLAKPTKAAANTLDDLGVKVFSANGKMKPMTQVIKDFQDGMRGMTQEQKTAALATIFGTESVSGMMAVLNTAPSKFSKMQEALQQSDGSAAKTAAQMKDNLKGAIEQLGGAMESAAITIGTALVPTLQKITTFVQSIVDKFNALSPTMQNFIAVGGAVAASVLLIGAGAASLISAIPALITGISALGTVFTAMTGPVGLTIMAIAGIVAVLVLAYNKVGWFRDGVNAAWAMVQTAWTTAVSAISSVTSSVISAISAFIGSQLAKIKAFWSQNGTQIISIVSSYIAGVKSTIQNGMQFIKGIFQAVWPLITGVIQVAWGVIKTVISAGIDAVLGTIKFAMQLLQGNWSGAWQTVKSTASKIWDDIVIGFKSIDLVGIGKNIIQGLVNGIGSMASAVVDKVKSVASSVVSTAKKFLGIHSPSRVMRDQVGKHVGTGFAKGIHKSTSLVKSAAAKQAKAAAAASKRVTEKIKNLEVKFSTKQIGASSYIASLKNVRKQNKLTGDQSRRITKDIYRAQQTQSKAQQAASKAQEKARAAEKKRVEAQYKAKDSLNKKVLSANSSFLTKFKSVNKKLTDGIKKANDDYKKAVADRADSLYNSVGLFDRAESKQTTTKDLTFNLKSQLKQFKKWQSDVRKLSKSAPKSLISELQEMGVGSASEVNALARMSKSQLGQYVKMWKQKHSLANGEATKELAPLKASTQKNIAQLRANANKELAQLKVDYIAKLKSLASDVKKLGDLKNSGKVLGKNTVAGIISGLKNSSGALKKNAKSLANSITHVIKKALGIHSPSRVMRDLIGKNVVAGVIKGMVGMKSNAMATAQSMADWVTPNVPTVATSVPAALTKGTQYANSKIKDTRSKQAVTGGNQAHKLHVENVIMMDGKEIARATAQPIDVIQGKKSAITNFMKGRR